METDFKQVLSSLEIIGLEYLLKFKNACNRDLFKKSLFAGETKGTWTWLISQSQNSPERSRTYITEASESFGTTPAKIIYLYLQRVYNTFMIL